MPTSSDRRHSASPTWANFVAAYAPMNGTPRLPTIDETMMMWPALLARNTRRAARAAWKVPSVVDLEQLPHLVGRTVDGAVDAEAGVADHHVEPAEPLDRGAPRTRPCRRRASRRRPRAGLAAGGGDLGGHGSQPIRPPRADGNRRAIARQPQRRARPMPADAPVMATTRICSELTATRCGTVEATYLDPAPPIAPKARPTYPTDPTYLTHPT